FGAVSGTTTNGLSATSIPNSLGNNLNGKTLNPNAENAASVVVNANDLTTLSSSSTIDDKTAVGKTFYVTDFENHFNNLTVGHSQKVAGGLITLEGTLSMENSSELSVGDMEIEDPVTITCTGCVLSGTRLLGSGFTSTGLKFQYED